MSSRPPEAGAPRLRLPTLLPGLLLAAVTAAAFSPALGNGFLAYDDDSAITGNPRVAAGLGAAGLRWALTSTEHANWHPLTWLAYQALASVFGLRPWAFHLAGLLLHVLAALLLLRLLRLATGAAAASLVAAALFALHPLRVESVAWAAELKDPLSAVFFLLALLAHVRFARRGRPADRLAVVGAAALGLMAKPMLVTLPFVLLLVDHWPLGRWSRREAPRLLREKAPLLLMAAAAGAATYVAQSREGAVRSLLDVPLGTRLLNAPVAAAAYLGDFLWPFHLSAYHPLGGGSAPAAAAAAVFLAAVTTLVLRRRATGPFLAVGWAWYLVMVAPVSGIVQVGLQARADRYTYLPLIGVALATTWAGRELVRSGRLPRGLAAVAAALVLGLLATLTPARARLWRDTGRLFADALARDPDNWFAHLKLAEALRTEGRTAEALAHAERAAAGAPRHPNPPLLAGLILGETGRYAEAEARFREALRLEPGWNEGLLNLGLAIYRQGRYEEALVPLREELRQEPASPRALLAAGVVELAAGRPAAAERHGRTWLHVEPRAPLAYVLLGRAREAQGDAAQAGDAFRAALALDPGLEEARAGLARLAARTGGTAP